MTSKGSCSGWKAWHDNQPSGPATLHVTGECTFPTTGYSVELKPHSPQGINPSIYLMDRIVQEPSGNVGQKLTVVNVHYRELTKAKYSEIHIVTDNVHIPVKEAS